MSRFQIFAITASILLIAFSVHDLINKVDELEREQILKAAGVDVRMEDSHKIPVPLAKKGGVEL